MRIRALLVGLMTCSVLAAGESVPPGGWTALFNGQDLAGWYTYLPSQGRNQDPQRIFQVHDGMIHILNIPVTGAEQEFGYIATEQEYSDVRIHLEYKWGEKRFAPRHERPRDSGLLYHFVGPDKIWPRSVECQIQENDTGDFWVIDRTGMVTTIAPEEAPPRFDPDGLSYMDVDRKNWRVRRATNVEKARDWNTVEVILSGDRAVHVVNGTVVNEGWDLRQPDAMRPGYVPLTRGRLVLQAEGAEVFFRNVWIRNLDPRPTASRLAPGR